MNGGEEPGGCGERIAAVKGTLETVPFPDQSNDHGPVQCEMSLTSTRVLFTFL